MLKVLNFIVVMLFVLVASAAPYVSAKGAALAFAQNPEERTSTSQGANLEEEIHHTASHSIYFDSVEIFIIYPQVIELKPQQVLCEILKPPSRSIS